MHMPKHLNWYLETFVRDHFNGIKSEHDKIDGRRVSDITKQLSHIQAYWENQLVSGLMFRT